MKVISNNGSAVVIEATADEAATLAGRHGFTDAIALQDQLREELADTWHAAGCPPATGGDEANGG